MDENKEKVELKGEEYFDYLSIPDNDITLDLTKELSHTNSNDKSDDISNIME